MSCDIRDRIEKLQWTRFPLQRRIRRRFLTLCDISKAFLRITCKMRRSLYRLSCMNRSSRHGANSKGRAKCLLTSEENKRRSFLIIIFGESIMCVKSDVCYPYSTSLSSEACHRLFVESNEYFCSINNQWIKCERIAKANIFFPFPLNRCSHYTRKKFKCRKREKRKKKQKFFLSFLWSVNVVDLETWFCLNSINY